MKILITDAELTAYAEGRMSAAESRELEKRAAATGQADLLLSVIIAQDAIDRDLMTELWGDVSSDMKEELPMAQSRMAACIDSEEIEKNN